MTLNYKIETDRQRDAELIDDTETFFITVCTFRLKVLAIREFIIETDNTEAVWPDAVQISMGRPNMVNMSQSPLNKIKTFVGSPMSINWGAFSR